MEFNQTERWKFYFGANNGEIKLCYSELADTVGLQSPKSISAAMEELEGAGWISRSKFGGGRDFLNKESRTWEEIETGK